MEERIVVRKRKTTTASCDGDREDGVDAEIMIKPSGDGSSVCRGRDEQPTKTLQDFLFWISVVVGLVVMVVPAVKYARHVKLLHENEMWFSNIKEVEREISFRTEAGLYYSYFKQMVKAPSILQGLIDLTKDNITEHPSTINILARMNIYQEVILAAMYKMLPCIQEAIEPIYFYIDAILFLQGVELATLFLITWILSGTWLAGLLTAAFLVFSSHDFSRITLTMPLREHWSLPFFWIHIMFLTAYFTPKLSLIRQMFTLHGVFLAAFMFALTWQFNQFILLLQAIALFGCWILGIIPRNKVIVVYMTYFFSMLLVSVLQFGNSMILTGLLISFIPAALLVMFIEKRFLPVKQTNISSCSGRVIIHILLALILMKILNIMLRNALKEEGDEHIYKFVLSKLGLYDPRDFDVNLYLCNGAFQFMELQVFTRLSSILLFPIYVLVHVAILVAIVADIFIPWRGKQSADCPRRDAILLHDRPQLAYTAIQAMFYALLGISTVRMKYFWTPYMAILASAGLCDKHLWSWLLSRIKIHSKCVIFLTRHTVLLIVLAFVIYKALPPVLKELEELGEFYDPDTVDLMEWIKMNTSETAAFTGSMQLLAGVKLCTGRHITNHPHYEDKTLRLKTKELYQMYGHNSPEDVHSILVKYKTDYMILEDSICLSPNVGCRLPDIMDLDKGIIPKDGPLFDGLMPTKTPLFCDEIRYGKPAYTRFFKLVFSNRTFRVYQVLKLLTK